MKDRPPGVEGGATAGESDFEEAAEASSAAAVDADAGLLSLLDGVALPLPPAPAAAAASVLDRLSSRSESSSMMLRLDRIFMTISDCGTGFRSRLNLEAEAAEEGVEAPADDGVADDGGAGDRLPRVPAVDGADKGPIPLVTEPAFTRSYFANTALTRSWSESVVPEDVEEESFESEEESADAEDSSRLPPTLEASTVSTPAVVAVAGAVAAGATGAVVDAAAAAVGVAVGVFSVDEAGTAAEGFLATGAASCRRPSLGS